MSDLYHFQAPAPAGPLLLEAADPDQLVGAHLDGHPRAFDEIVRRFQPRLLAFVDRIVGDRARAEDLVQETFLRAARHLHRFDRSRSLSTWLHTIAANLARNELRRRRRSPVLSFASLPEADDGGQDLDVPDHRHRPDRLFHRRQLRRAVSASVAGLSPMHRQIFVMRELEGRSYEEIAAATGVELGTVKSRLNRARASFATLIESMIA